MGIETDRQMLLWSTEGGWEGRSHVSWPLSKLCWSQRPDEVAVAGSQLHSARRDSEEEECILFSLTLLDVSKWAVLASSSTNTKSKAFFSNPKSIKHIKMAGFFSFKRTMIKVIKTYKILLSLHIIYNTRPKHLLKFLFSNFLFRNKTFP